MARLVTGLQAYSRGLLFSTHLLDGCLALDFAASPAAGAPPLAAAGAGDFFALASASFDDADLDAVADGLPPAAGVFVPSTAPEGRAAPPVAAGAAAEPETAGLVESAAELVPLVGLVGAAAPARGAPRAGGGEGPLRLPRPPNTSAYKNSHVFIMPTIICAEQLTS